MEGIAEGYSPFAGYEFYEWNFGPAEPGKYTLNVPFVYQLLNEQLIAQENNAQRVWVDNDGGRLDAQFNIHDALIRLTDYKVSDYSDKSPDIDEITKILGDMDTVVLAASTDSASKSDCISLGKGSITNQCSLIAGFIRASSEHMAKSAGEDPDVI